MIEKDVDINQFSKNKKHERIHKMLREIEVGESFLIEKEEMKDEVVSPFIFYWGKKLDKKFSKRLLDDGTRIWRVK